MQVAINVSKEILRWVLQQSSVQGAPVEIIDSLTSWLSGERKPTYNQVEKVSKAVKIPFGYFFLKRPPEENLSIVEYRTIDSDELINPSRNLVDTMKNMEIVQDWMHTYQIDTIDGRTYVAAMKDQEDIDVFADYIRETLSLNGDWRKGCNSSSDLFRVLRKAISDVGTIVMVNGIVGNNTHRPLNVQEFRAFAMVDNIAPLIFINNNDSDNGKLFSLLHEFAHICMGENSLFNEPISNQKALKKNEALCNAVAAEVLVPTKEFRNAWEKLGNTDIRERINEISKHYCCGVLVICRKALDNRFIDKDFYYEFAKEINKAFLDRQLTKGTGGGDYYRTKASRIDHNFLKSLCGSVSSGKTSYTDAFLMTDTNRKTYEHLMKSVGGLR